MFSISARRLFLVDDSEKKYEKKHVQDSKVQDTLRIVLLTTLALYLRVMKLNYPPFITEAELEAANQINWYMAGKFFIGRFPPLMAILNTLLARLAGYYGSEELLYAGQNFTAFPIVVLRRFSALLGAALIPLCYKTLRNMGHLPSTATLAAALLIFENGLVTQSRFVTPEIFVLFFGAFATFAWSSVNKQLKESQGILTTDALYWQTLTGVFMGCALSSKWTGFLMFPIIWTPTLLEAWNNVCEKDSNVQATLKKLAINLLTIGLLPLFVYLFIFQIHFNLASFGGEHDLLISSKLRFSLNGNYMKSTQSHIAYGSQIVLRHDSTVGGYLHSHKKRFSGGSTQQEVLLYPHNDLNNIWTIHKTNEMWNSSQSVEFVRNGDQIRIEHYASGRKLHSHDVRPQVSNQNEHSEVTAYGDPLIEDANDYWVLHILDKDGRVSKDTGLTWKPLSQKFKLKHIRGCTLISHYVWYSPPAGEDNQEITCMASPTERITHWTAESSFHPLLDKMQKVSHERISLFEKLQEVHRLMYKYPVVVYNRFQPIKIDNTVINPKITPAENANKWFFKKSSQMIWYELSGFSSHLILNSILQKMIIMSMLTFVAAHACRAFFSQRQIKLPAYLGWIDTLLNEQYTQSTVVYFGSIMIHLQCLKFLPSHMLSMVDILGIMYYGTGLVCVLLEACSARLQPMIRRVLFYGLLFACVTRFSQFSKLAYGGEKWYRAPCEKSGIEIDCLRFPPTNAEILEMFEQSGNRIDATAMTLHLDIGTSQALPFRYTQGQEEEADRQIAMMKHNIFVQEHGRSTGVYRYHRVMPTPGITPHEATVWAKEILEGGRLRIEQEKAAAAAAAQQQQEQMYQQTIKIIN